MDMSKLLNKDCLLDHIAVAVEDLDKAQKVYETLGLRFEQKREKVPDQGVITAFAPIDTNTRLELLGVYAEGPVKKFLEKRGPGIHHICFKVKDIAKKCLELKGEGFQFIYDKPQQGANNCLINFIHPKSTGGVLIELSEPKGHE